MLCQQHNSQLVVIDLQSKILNTMQVDDKERVIKNTNILITAASLLDIPVFVTEQYPKGLGKTDETLKKSIGETAGETLGGTMDEAADKTTDKTRVYEKTCFSCVCAEGFDRQLASATRDQYVLCGIEAHICVLQTAIELIGLGKDVFVVQDAVCSRSGLNKENALTRIRECHGVVSNVESVLFEWLRDAQHPKFKEISSLIR
jgi:nicotinamidase-related amidase